MKKLIEKSLLLALSFVFFGGSIFAGPGCHEEDDYGVETDLQIEFFEDTSYDMKGKGLDGENYLYICSASRADAVVTFLSRNRSANFHDGKAKVSSYYDEYGYAHYVVNDVNNIVIDSTNYGIFFAYKGDSLATATEYSASQFKDYPNEAMEGIEFNSRFDFGINGCAIKNITASSSLTDRYHTYSPEGTLCCYTLAGDWNKNNVPWVEGAEGDGIGEYIEFDVADHQGGALLKILNGYVNPMKPHLFRENNRIKSALIETDTGLKQVIWFRDVVEFKEFRLPENTKHVKITIWEVYKGTKYSDTCISGLEIFCYSWGR